MRTYLRLVLLTGLAGLVLVSGTRADDDASRFGTQPGKFIPGPFQSFNVTGERSGRYHCLVCRYGLAPAVLVITRQLPEGEQPLTDLIKKLDAAAQKYSDYRMGAGIIFLSDEQDVARVKLIQTIETLGKTLDLKRAVLGLATTESEGPKKYAIAPEAETTVLLYNRHQVAAKHVFTKDKPLTEKDVETIIAQIDKMVPKKKLD